jgi:hypothetical protein
VGRDAMGGGLPGLGGIIVSFQRPFCAHPIKVK